MSRHSAGALSQENASWSSDHPAWVLMRLLKVMGQWGDGVMGREWQEERKDISQTSSTKQRHLSKFQLREEIEGGSQAKERGRR